MAGHGQVTVFPHLTAWENVAFGLRQKGISAAQLKDEVDQALTTMGLSHMHDRAPGKMSGGQQQRVALARAMVMRPKILLFDEPLSSLDAKMRVAMRSEIRRLQRRLGITGVYVTHDQDEAMSISDRIVVMRGGRIEQVATPVELYRKPASVLLQTSSDAPTSSKSTAPFRLALASPRSPCLARSSSRPQRRGPLRPPLFFS